METFFVDENTEPVWRVCQTRPTTLLTLMLPIFLIFSGSGTVIINEVELNPAGDDRSQDVLEWVELYNTGNEDVDISDWALVATHGDKEIVRIPSGSLIEAKGFYAIPDHPPREQWLDNQDESIVLKDNSGAEVDRTPTLADDRDDSCAWSRYPDGSPDWEFMISSKGARASGDFCYSGREDDALSCCFGEYDDESLWNVSCLDVGDQPDSCLIEDLFIESEECETSNEDECWIEQEGDGFTNASYYLKFEMNQAVSGAGFVNVDNDYYTTPFGDVISVELNTKEHGSGSYESEESTQLLRVNRSIKFDNISFNVGNASIEMDKDVSASYTTTTLGLPRNRSVTYSSTWTEEACSKSRMRTPVVGSKYGHVYHFPWCYHVDQIESKNRIWFSSPGDAYAHGYRACMNCIQDTVTDTSMSESYRYATSIDRESRIVRDQDRSTMVVDSEFDGMGHIGVLKLSDPGASSHGVPVIEAREDYIGSFRIYDRIDEDNSSLTFNKSTSGTGFVDTSKRIKEGQKTYEYGTGTYDSEEMINTASNYMAKDISVVHAPTSQSLTDDISLDQDLKWKEGMSSKNPKTSFIGEEYTSIESLDKETEVRGLNEMSTEAVFSGKARYRAVVQQGYWSYHYGRAVYISAMDLVEEWVQITNRGDGPVNMTGWSLSDKGDIHTRPPFPEGFTLFPGAIVTVHSGHGRNSTTDLYMKYNDQIWNNDGDCAILRDEKNNLVDRKCIGADGDPRSYEINMDEQYEGDYSIHRRITFTGVPKYDQPHLNVTKTGKIDQLNCSERSSIIRYTITLENDGNKTLGPVYVNDFFPPSASFIDSSMRPTEQTTVSANWTLTHLAIGDSATITLILEVSGCDGDEIVNKVKACGGYGDSWVCATNFVAIDIFSAKVETPMAK